MIRLVVPWLPPSSNQAYANMRGGGGRTLTTKGRKFKTLTTTHFAQKYRKEMMFWKPNLPYLIVMRFHFAELLNDGYPKKAKSRYKVFDGGNRTKLLEDCLKDAGGIDDSQTLTSIWQKEQAAKEGEEHTIIWAWSLEEEGCELNDLVRSLV